MSGVEGFEPKCFDCALHDIALLQVLFFSTFGSQNTHE